MPPLVVAGVVVAATVAATAVSVSAQARQGKVAAQTAEFNARQQANQAEQEARLGERRQAGVENEVLAEQQALGLDLETRQQQFSRQFAERRAQTLGAGVELTGAPLLTAVTEAREAELDQETLRFGSAVRQQQLRDEARLEGFQAEELRRGAVTSLGIGRAKAQDARQGARLAALGTGLSGVASVGRTLVSSGVVGPGQGGTGG
jgi:hypothetical protein